ncbi:mitogen-activated protein kinase kinase kinase [Rhizoctonia solani]|uniref:Mitogen-activated protein kinase kinase kinase n=1 Tax=Rhizoctonia solani TaxID=456999 RepID=A0A0K6GAX7_9AGAM|nr:mitogen-activated protein kinase kinase kinase [Rhizoctonia solani]
MADHTTKAPRHLGRRRAIKILAVANPDASSSSGSDENAPADTYITKPPSKPHVAPNLPTGKASNNADAGPSQRQSAVRPPSVPRALPLPPTQASPQRSVTKERIIVAVTNDGEKYVFVDLTGLTDSQVIRERILSKLRIPDDLHPIFDIYRTELGWIAIGGALDDNQLMIDCQHFGDEKGTLKFLVQPTDVPSEYPSYRTAPASGATTVPPYISPPSHHTHSRRPSETDSAITLVAEERRREEENERWMAKKRAELASKRQQWARDHPNLDNPNPSLAYQNGVGTSAGSSGYIPHGAPTAEAFPPNRTGNPMRTPKIHSRRLTDAQQQQQPQAPIRQQDLHYDRQIQQARQPSPGGQPFVAPPLYPQLQAYLSQQPQQPSNLLHPPPLPQTPRQTKLLPALIGAKYTDFAQQERPQSANGMLPHLSHPGPRPAMQRPLSEHDRPSTSDLDRSPPLPQTPRHRMLPLASDNDAAASSALSASLVGYAGQARDTNSDRDPTMVASEPDTTNVNSEAGSFKVVQHMVDGPRKVTPPIPTTPSSLVSQLSVPATNPQPAYIQRQSKVIPRDFVAVVQREESDESDDGSETLWKISEQNLAPPATARTTAGAPLTQRMAARPAGSSNGDGIDSEVPSQSSLHPHESSSSSSWDTMIPVSNILRKRSTKMWGSRVEEVAPGSAALEIGAALNAPDTNPEGVPGREQATFKWVKGELIGQGSFGRVYHAMNLTTGELIAVKQIELPKAGSNRADSRQISVVDAVKSESNMLRDLDHPHIVQYLGFEETMDVFSLFMEYVPGGSIRGFLSKVGKFEDEVVRSFSHQIIDGLAYLHKSGILHRDLKGNSILVDRSGICKISDFSISKHNGTFSALNENIN